MWPIRLVRSTTLPEGRAALASPTTQLAFVCNLAQHWLTVRRFAHPTDATTSFWFNLNSLLPKPQYLSDFYLDTFLNSLSARVRRSRVFRRFRCSLGGGGVQGYDIFVVFGQLPPVRAGTLDGDNGEWFAVTLTPNVVVHDTPASRAAAAAAASTSSATTTTTTTSSITTTRSGRTSTKRRSPPPSAVDSDSDDDAAGNAALEQAIASSLASASLAAGDIGHATATAAADDDDDDAQLKAALAASLLPSSDVERRDQDDANDEEDEELRIALEMSRQK